MALHSSKAVKRAFWIFLSLVVVVGVVTVFVVPPLFGMFPSIIRGFIFVPNKEIPDNVDYKHPEEFGFLGGRNFYLTTKDGATLGVWHTLPTYVQLDADNLKQEGVTVDPRDRSMAGGTVWLYLHGSAGTRTSPHRTRLYHLLNSMGYHLVTFDYRGYGDSTSSPLSETNLIEDTMTVFKWIQDRVPTGNILIWGHSLGTGVAAHVADQLISRGDVIKGVVLEAPFNNMADTVRDSIISALSFLPWFNYCFIQPLYDNDLSFQSDKHLKNISTPVLILHAKDDRVIAFRLASKLYEEVQAARKDPSSVQMVAYNCSLRYGHYDIALDPNLNSTVRKFVESSIL